MQDIFEFWGQIRPTARIHPADEAVFKRVTNHGMNLNCLPSNISGPLRTARVVLLFLNPGFNPANLAEPKTKAGREKYVTYRSGCAPLSPAHDSSNPIGKKWRASRLAFLGDWEVARHKTAIMNIGAYHSKNFADHDLLASLPSSRAAIDWAQRMLFPEAEAGKRVVICLRAAHYWGLQPGNQYGRSLFAPHTTRGGHMRRGPLRDKIVRAAQRAIAGRADIGIAVTGRELAFA